MNRYHHPLPRVKLKIRSGKEVIYHSFRRIHKALALGQDHGYLILLCDSE